MRDCLSDEELRRYLDDGMEAAEETAAEAHFGACPTCTARLRRASDGSADAGLRRLSDSFRPATLAFPPPVAPGAIGRLDCYDIERSLGGGGMGQVFRAYDTSLKRHVALKIINPEFAALPGYRKRFAREAHTAARVASDYVVRVYRVADGAPGFTLPFLVSELVEGQPLDRYLETKQGQQKPVTAREAAGIAHHVALGLSAIHAAGLVHRDIKPSNILLDKASRRARITDFGLARSIEALEDRFTRTAATPGTPAYMSPEQYAHPGAIDERSDLFSLGIVLYRLLTGQRPFAGETPGQIGYQVQFTNPPAPRRIDARIPPDLETICLVCIDKDPDHRYANAQALADDLRRFLNHEPIRARPPTRRRRLVLFARRNRGLLRLAAGFAVMMLTGGAVMLGALKYQQSQTDDARKRETIAKKKEEAASIFAKGETRRAESNKQEAERRKERERGVRYLTDVKEAYKAWEKNAPEEARLLLERHLPANSSSPDLRGVEWYYLDYTLGTNHRVLDFGGDVMAARFSPDGARLAAFGAANNRGVYCIKTWKPPAKQPERTLLVDRITSGVAETPGIAYQKQFANLPGPEYLAFNRDGSLLVATCRVHHDPVHEGLIKVWDATTGREIFSAADAGIAGKAVLFSPDGKHLIAGGYNNAAFVWDVPGGQLRWTLPGHVPPLPAGRPAVPTSEIARPGANRGVHTEVTHLLFSPSGKYLYRGTARTQWPPPRAAIYDDRPNYVPDMADLILAYQPGGAWGISKGASQSTAQLFLPVGDAGEWLNAKGGLPIVPGFKRLPRQAAYNRPKRKPLPGQVVDAVVEPKVGYIETLAFGPSDLAVAGKNGTIEVLKIDNRGKVASRSSPRGHKGIVKGLVFGPAPANSLVAIGSTFLTLWGSAAGTSRPPFFQDDRSIPPAVTVQGRWGYRRIVTNGTGPEIIEIYDLAPGGVLVRRISTPVKRFRGVAVSPTGDLLAVAEDDLAESQGRKSPGHKVFILDIATGKIVRVLTMPGLAPSYLQFDKEGTTLLSNVPIENTLLFWDVATGKLLRQLNGHGEYVGKPEYSPDYRWIVSGDGKTGMIDLWDLETGEVTASFQGQPDKLAWAFNGTLLAVPVRGRQIKVWDLEKRQFVQQMSDLGRDIEALGFFADGKRLASVSGGSVTLWSLELDSEIATIPAPYGASQMPRLLEALDRRMTAPPG